MADLDAQCLFQALDRFDVQYVLIGGLAAVVHGSSLATFDIDITPAPGDENLTRLAESLRSINSRIRVLGDVGGVEFDPHPALLGSISVLNLTTDCGPVSITASPIGIPNYADWDARASVVNLHGVSVRVASLEDIITSEEAADRPKDRAALPILKALQDELAG